MVEVTIYRMTDQKGERGRIKKIDSIRSYDDSWLDWLKTWKELLESEMADYDRPKWDSGLPCIHYEIDRTVTDSFMRVIGDFHYIIR